MFGLLNSEEDSTKRNWQVFLVLLFLTFMLRLVTFFALELDHDVSTYLVMANEWIKGATPFVEYVDVKPIGIYAIFALGIKIFGHSILVPRILAVFFVSGTAYFLYKAKYLLHKQQSLAFAVAIIFVLISSVHKWSWAANTELFFTFFTALGLFLILKAKRNIDFIFMGLAMGLGFIIKYHILFDFAAFAALFLLKDWKAGGWICRLRQLSIAFIFFLVPFGLCHFMYWYSGYYPEFLEASFGIPSRYSNVLELGMKLKFIGEFYLAFIPFSILFILSIVHLIKTKTSGAYIPIFYLIWLVATWAAILITGKSFFHYYFQALLPLAFVSWDWVELNTKKSAVLNFLRKRKLVLCVAIGLIILVAQIWQIPKYHDTVGRDMQVRISQTLKASDRIFIEQNNLLYFTLNSSPIEKYIHNSLMYNQNHVRAFRIDLKKEYAKVRKTQPQYLLLKNLNHAYLGEWIDRNYQVQERFENGYVLLKRI
jgi:4-amino-4-deoxy-L-arabinose transferase-like glycosyltransferase